MPRRAVVIRLKNPPGRQCGDVHCAKRVVEELLRIGSKGSKRFACAVVAGVGLGGREAARQGALHRRHPRGRVERFAGVAAVAEHIEPAVPRGGQRHFEPNLRSNQTGHAAVDRRIRACRNRRGRHDREFVSGERDQRGARGPRSQRRRVAQDGALPVPELRPVLRARRCDQQRDDGSDVCQSCAQSRRRHTHLSQIFWTGSACSESISDRTR